MRCDMTEIKHDMRNDTWHDTWEMRKGEFRYEVMVWLMRHEIWDEMSEKWHGELDMTRGRRHCI